MYLLFIINRLCLKTYSHVSCTLQATCSQMVINDETGTLVPPKPEMTIEHHISKFRLIDICLDDDNQCPIRYFFYKEYTDHACLFVSIPLLYTDKWREECAVSIRCC